MANTSLGLFKTRSGEDALADVSSLALWLEKQPVNDYLGTQEAMVRLLEDMAARQPKVTSNRVQAVLELDRVSTPVQARLLKQYLQPSLSDAVRQRLWHASDDLARWFAYTYEQHFEALHEFFRSQKARGLLPGVAARMFYYRGQQAKNLLFRYERWMPGRWKGLHAAYATTRDRSLARVRFALAPEDPAAEHCTAEHEYLQILLMQRVNTGNLGAQQIEMAACWLRSWVSGLTLAEPPLEGAGLWLDLGLGDGLLAKKPQTAAGQLLYLDIAPLQKEIGDGMVELSVQLQDAGSPAARAVVKERLTLLQRLEQLWRPKPRPTERRGVRVQTDRPVHCAAGLVEIAAAMHSGDATNAEFYRRFRRHDPVEIAGGRERPAFGSADPGAIDFDDEDAKGWRMHDSSESGCRLVSASREAAQQKLGSLLGIQEQGDARWVIGVVRRLKKFSGGQTELGVEFIARNAMQIAPRAVASRDTGYSVDGIDVSAEGTGFAALYLPPMESPGRAPRRSMLVPVSEYGERRRFLLSVDDNVCTIEFTTPLERTKEWVWSGFEIVAGEQ